MAVGRAAYAEISKPEFLARVRDVSNHLGQALEGLKDRHPELVVELRGKGLLRGIKLTVKRSPKRPVRLVVSSVIPWAIRRFQTLASVFSNAFLSDRPERPLQLLERPPKPPTPT